MNQPEAADFSAGAHLHPSLLESIMERFNQKLTQKTLQFDGWGLKHLGHVWWWAELACTKQKMGRKQTLGPRSHNSTIFMLETYRWNGVLPTTAMTWFPGCNMHYANPLLTQQTPKPFTWAPPLCLYGHLHRYQLAQPHPSGGTIFPTPHLC